MVSSTVYGNEELLERIYTLLTEFGYEVWMSHKGTMPVLSHRSAYENCITGVEKCDLFLGFITPRYGSKINDTGISITHLELKTAISLNKARWLLGHAHVVIAKSLLDDLGYEGEIGRENLSLEKNHVLDDLRVINMYEEAILSQKPSEDRQGDWVQKFSSDDDASLFAMAQFSRYQEVESFVKENLQNSTIISTLVRKRDQYEPR